MIEGKPTITFDESAKDFVLESLKLKVDEEGYVCEAGLNGLARVQTPTNETVKKSQWAGFIVGYGHVKGDIINLMHLADWADKQIQKGVRHS